MSWSKLDVSAMVKTGEDCEKLCKKLSNKLEGVDGMSPFSKLKEVIIGFKESCPLIEALSSGAVEERHWRRILEETGKDTGEVFNIKTMTLSKVFEMELQNYEEKVLEIIVEAKEEAKNESNLKMIEEAWRLELFEIIQYKKATTGAPDEK
jgi:hypothetical protein